MIWNRSFIKSPFVDSQFAGQVAVRQDFGRIGRAKAGNARNVFWREPNFSG